MKKSILGLCLTLVMVMSTAFGSFAGQWAPTATGAKRLTRVSLADINRIVEVTDKVRGQNVPEGYKSIKNADSGNKSRIINAQRLSNTEWVIRLSYEDGDQCESDFYVSALDYSYDRESGKITSLPFDERNIQTGTELYGPCWYYVGVFADNDPNTVCGILLFQRINERRWPLRTDLSYSGSTGKLEKGTYHTVTGSYTQPCSDTFVEANLNK